MLVDNGDGGCSIPRGNLNINQERMRVDPHETVRISDRHDHGS